MRVASCKVRTLEIKEDAGHFIQREIRMTIVRMWQFEVESGGLAGSPSSSHLSKQTGIGI